SLLPPHLALTRRPAPPTLFPYTTLFRSGASSHSRSLDTLWWPPLHPRYALARAPWTSGEALSIDRSVRLARLSEFVRREPAATRSEEHTSELQSRFDLVCRLLLEKKKLV